MKALIAASGTLAALTLSACAGTGAAGHSVVGVEHEEEDYRISVEIPLDAMRVQEGDIVKVDELLDERTSFKPDDFQLDEVVLIARADGVDGHAELLVLEWRSGKVAVPTGRGDDWFEVRIPAPDEDLAGAWLLDVGGAVTVDTLVAVLEPRPQTLSVAKTAYRSTTVYRDGYRHAPRPSIVWMYDPNRYYVYHYYGVWPYRYFVGPWSYRHYDLAYRPRWHRHAHYWPRQRGHDRRRWRDNRQRAPRQGRRTVERTEARGEAATPRRLDPRFAKLRRSHPRLRQWHRGRQEPQRPGRRHEIQQRPDAPATAADSRRAGLRARSGDANNGARVFERRQVERRSSPTTRERTRGTRGQVDASGLPRLQRRTAATPRRTLRDISLPGPSRPAIRRQREAAPAVVPRNTQAQPRARQQGRRTYAGPRTFERVPDRRAAPRRSQPTVARPAARRFERTAPAGASRAPSFERRTQPAAPRQAPVESGQPARSSTGGARRDMRVVERR